MKKIIIIILVLLIPFKVSGLSAKSAILMDIKTNRVLYKKDIHNIKSVASISKIMTAIIAIESGKLEEEVIIGDEIENSYGSGIYIKKGEKIKLIDLVYGLLLRSGNDAAASISKYISDDFVNLMNIKANEIGLINTTFNNPSGLDEEDGNFSTAYDMALLMSYAYKNKIFRKIINTKKYKVKTNMNTYIWYNKDKLLYSYKYCTGGKTGYTKKAKRTLINTASNNLDLVVVTLNDPNDWKDHKTLFEYGFNNYKYFKILDKKKIIKDSYYKKLYIKNNYYYPIRENEKGKIKIKYKLKKIRLNYHNKKVGYAYIYFNNELIHKEVVYAK